MRRNAHNPGLTPLRAGGLALLSAALFVAVAAARLDGPGLYYDEVHQVPAAFAWRGAAPQHFCLAWLGGVPWLTMTYSGAVKSALFAALLAASGAEFSAALWRGFGIALVAVGWIWCCAAIGRRWGRWAELAAAALLLSDTTVLLTTRHDWGPTALALMLRCAFVAVWLRRERLSSADAFALGAITGLAIFEKLSSAVLLVPLTIALAGAPRRRQLLAGAGLSLGALPLAIVNLAAWWQQGRLISLTNLFESEPGAWTGWSWERFVVDYLSLGQGDWVRRWMLDRSVGGSYVWVEAIVLAALLAMAFVLRDSRRLVAAYVATGVALALLPRRTGAHHWIIGTPFQYAAIAALVGRTGALATPSRLLLLVLLAMRLPAWWDTTAAIRENRTAARFDPEYTRVAARLAARDDAIVVASTWGIANQIVALAQGRTDAVYEPIYEDVEVERFERMLDHSRSCTLYLAEVPAFADVFPARTARIDAAIAADRWREVPAADEPPGSSAVRVRMFVDHRNAHCRQSAHSAIEDAGSTSAQPDDGLRHE